MDLLYKKRRSEDLRVCQFIKWTQEGGLVNSLLLGLTISLLPVGAGFLLGVSISLLPVGAGFLLDVPIPVGLGQC